MELTVAELMTDVVETIDENETLLAAAELMDSIGIRHLPVLNGDKDLVGVLSYRDLVQGGRLAELGLEARRDLLMSQQVGEYCSRDPQTVTPEDTISDAGLMLLEGKIGSLPVMENDRVVGILTESDFVKFVVENADLFENIDFHHSERREEPYLRLASLRGRETGEGEGDIVPGGWEGSDDATSTTGSDRY